MILGGAQEQGQKHFSVPFEEIWPQRYIYRCAYYELLDFDDDR